MGASHHELAEAARDPAAAVPGPRPAPDFPAQPAFAPAAMGLAVLTLFLVLCFNQPLCGLVRYSLHSELYSYILLIPFISLYMVWIKRRDLPEHAQLSLRLAAIPLVAGSLILAVYWAAVHAGWKPKTNDYLALMTLAFLSFLLSSCLVCLGSQTVRVIAFALGFLIFTVPLPEFFERAIESLLQHGSASAAGGLLKLSGMPVMKSGMELHLPGFSMEVASECSGIHSSVVLFITSVLAGHMLLTARWTRAVLVLVVIPLAILRNGFRIFVLGELCVNVSPDWINSDLHHRGGPIFFILSLIPFFLLLWFLKKFDRQKAQVKSC